MITTPSVWGMLMDCLNNSVYDLVKAGAPVNGTSGDGANLAGPGSFLYDLTNKVLYINVNTLASPTWAPWSLNDPTSNASGTVQSTEYTLNSVTLPANFMAGTRGIQVECWGNVAGNANAKNFKIYLGGTAVVTVTGSVANGGDYYGTATILRTGNSTQTGVGFFQVNTATAGAMAVNAAIAETDTAAIVIAVKSANTAAAAASGTGKGLAVTLLF